MENQLAFFILIIHFYWSNKKNEKNSSFVCLFVCFFFYIFGFCYLFYLISDFGKNNFMVLDEKIVVFYFFLFTYDKELIFFHSNRIWMKPSYHMVWSIQFLCSYNIYFHPFWNQLICWIGKKTVNIFFFKKNKTN